MLALISHAHTHSTDEGVCHQPASAHRMCAGMSGSSRSDDGSEYLRTSFSMYRRCSTYQLSTVHHTCTAAQH